MSSRFRRLGSTRISFFAFQDIITSVSGILILVVLMLSTEIDRPEGTSNEPTDPEMLKRLSDIISQQQLLDERVVSLQELLAVAATAPATEKLQQDIQELEAKLREAQARQTNLGAQLAAAERSSAQRDRVLGLTDLLRRIQALDKARELLASSELRQRDEMRRLEELVRSSQSRLLKLRAREGNLWLVPDRNATTKEPILVTLSSSGGVVERFDRPAEKASFSAIAARTEFARLLQSFNSLNQYIVFLVRPSGIPAFKTLVEFARDKDYEVGFDALAEGQTVHFSPPPRDEEEPTVPGAAEDVNQQVGSPGKGASHSNAAAVATPARSATAKSSSPAAVPSSPPPAKKKSWWRALLEWLGLA